MPILFPRACTGDHLLFPGFYGQRKKNGGKPSRSIPTIPDQNLSYSYGLRNLTGALSLDLLEIKDLSTHFFTRSGVIKAVSGLNLTLQRAAFSDWSANPVAARP
jgi:hypothetical protein